MYNLKKNKHINLLREFSIPLLMGVSVALAWANLDHKSYEWLIHTPIVGGVNLHFLTNDLFMVLFFGIAAAEITESCLPGGDLNPPRKALNAIIATIGGVVGPAAVYLTLNMLFGSSALRNGWGIPTATDIALAWLVARTVFGRNHPAVAFLLLLAIADDAIGLLIIAIFYPNPHHPPEPLMLLLIPLGMLFAWGLRSARVKPYWPYLITGGLVVWTGLYLGNLHPALALAFIVPFMPHEKKETVHMFEEDAWEHSTLDKFVHDWRLFVDFGMFMFGLVNAGVEISHMGVPTILVLLGLLIGKVAGISLFSSVAHQLGWHRPHGMGAKETLLVGCIAAIGFTVSLFIAGEAFTDPALTNGAKMGALLSIGIAVPAVLGAKLLKISKRQ
ncbi:sodium/proton antiporter family protein [Geotalea daltonii FRC-32]|uniref:Sodium/proton antiporter family protein n=1 Tax=Geotalea daltonii (strain DSM 22248 / JCM 15807 / FRC-32) TaxID=316067 RepID=B9M262_GEODF|nr:Na+/H+ antiporter NhaA [Geotalea daltonii]ACM21180.1 sodium/proton antiporter family protein [Geotalea daltonii FRC-32]